MSDYRTLLRRCEVATSEERWEMDAIYHKRLSLDVARFFALCGWFVELLIGGLEHNMRYFWGAMLFGVLLFLTQVGHSILRRKQKKLHSTLDQRWSFTHKDSHP